MIGTRFVLRNGALVPIEQAGPKSGALKRNSNTLSDIAPFTTQEGVEISSRSGLRAYEQKNGVKQVGNDFASHTAELRRKVYGES